MRISHTVQPRLRLAVLGSFIAACALIFGYLWVNMGGTIPAVTSEGYRVQVVMDDVDNAVFDSDIRIAGVPVGKVRALDTSGGDAKVTLQFDDADVVPLHEGAQIHLRAKSLVEETYLEVVDGGGAEIPDGAELPGGSVAEPVQLHDVLRGLDPQTRAALGRSIRSLDVATRGSEADVAAALQGLGDLGTEGHDVLDVIAAQSDDLDDMTRSIGVVMRALDEGDGDLVSLVESANRLSSATAASQDDVRATMQALPRVVRSAHAASGDLSALATDLAPIARDLRTAAPELNRALERMPAVTRDLRGLLPSLDTVLDRAPATLERTSRLAGDVSDIVPPARVALADLNPVLAYLARYDRDITAFFTNWAAMMANSDANGHYLRVFLVFNETSVKNYPFESHTGVLDKRNSYPAPGAGLSPGPFDGTYPHVEEDSP